MRKYRWTQNEENLLVEMVNIASENNGGRIDWRFMRTIGHHNLSALQTRWSKMLKPDYKWDGKKYVLSERTVSEVATPKKRVERSRATPEIRQAKVSRSFLWGAIKYERYE